MALNEHSVRSRLGRVGWRTGSYYCGSRVMPVEERGLTSGAFLEETNSPEIGFAYQLHLRLGGHGKNFTGQRRGEVFGVTTEMQRHLVCW